jgi:hypothetical protein
MGASNPACCLISNPEIVILYPYVVLVYFQILTFVAGGIIFILVG